MVITQILIDWSYLFAMSTALGLLLHEAGLICLGHGGLLLTGAYAFALAALQTISSPTAVVLVLAVAMIAALVVLRVGSDIFAVVTLAFGTIMARIANAAIDWTGGPLGLGPLPRQEWLKSDSGALVAGAILCLCVSLCYCLIGRSTFGLTLGACRDNEIATRVQGKPTAWVRYLAVVISGLLASGVGLLQACYFGLVTPRMGAIDVTLQAVAAAMLAAPAWRQGRPLRTLIGYGLASGLLVATPPFLRWVLPGSVEEAVLRQALFGLVMFALVQPRIWSCVSGGSGSWSR